uniref:SecY-independent transporter protein n=1 Tax=Tetraselmis sp. CCMP 881 TaxID=1812852 RepID=A0A650AR64_9CHLO|nr:SecY-independent transporter protein [Tetraselmis sp. CCMP 881]
MNSFFFHTEEIKYRCIYGCISLMTIFITSCISIYPILFYMTKPLKVITTVSIMVTDLLEFWVVVVNFSVFLSFFLFFPTFLYSVWAFIIPSLYPVEKKIFSKFFRMSLSFFILGNLVSFYYILPLVISYCFQDNQTVGFLDLQYMPKLASYISFLSYYLLGFFFLFQFPVILIALIEFQLLTYRKLSSYRKIIYSFFLLLSAFLSPPDIISELFLTSILIVIIEFLIFYSCLHSKYKSINERDFLSDKKPK